MSWWETLMWRAEGDLRTRSTGIVVEVLEHAPLQRLRLPGEGSAAQLFELAAHIAARPFDPNRPQWEATLVTGLPDGRAGCLLEIHHSMTDGLGLVQLLELAHGRTTEAEAPDTSPLPSPGRSRPPPRC